MLLLAALEQERRQRWAYDYFVFMDDDVQLANGSRAGFELFLQVSVGPN